MMFSMLLKYNRIHAARKSSPPGGATPAQRRYPTWAATSHLSLILTSR